jgi:hypothetical protein
VSVVPADQLPKEKRSSVLIGAELCFSKQQLLGTLGNALRAHEIESSMLIVLCPPSNGTVSRGAQKSGLEPLGVILPEIDYDGDVKEP